MIYGLAIATVRTHDPSAATCSTFSCSSLSVILSPVQLCRVTNLQVKRTQHSRYVSPTFVAEEIQSSWLDGFDSSLCVYIPSIAYCLYRSLLVYIDSSAHFVFISINTLADTTHLPIHSIIIVLYILELLFLTGCYRALIRLKPENYAFNTDN